MNSIDICIVVNSVSPLSNKELEEVVEADIKKFEKFFCEKLDNPKLSGPEVAIIKTYLWFKLHPEAAI